MRRGWRAVLGSALVIVMMVGAVAAGPTAGAATRMVVARGPCSGDSHWRLVLVKDEGRIGIGYKVVEGVAGHPWRVRIFHNRRLILRTIQVTHGDEGAFAVRVWTRNTHGPDLIRARARNLVTEERCRGRALI